jgi:hypothetical protein
MAVKTLALFYICFGEQFPKVCTILSYIEFMADNSLAPATIRNYISSVKAVFKRLNIDVVNFDSHLVKLALKSLDKNAIDRYKPKPILYVEQLSQLLLNMKHNFFAVAILFAFFGMLRKSNITCASMNNFDPLRHISRGDIQPSQQGLAITIKWSKTLQNYRQGAVIYLPSIPNSPLCPVTDFTHLNEKFPVPNNLPLLSYQAGATHRLINQKFTPKYVKIGCSTGKHTF